MGRFVQRYYDPSIGRFLSVDPVAAHETGDNFNRYAYANINPYRFTDPDGRESGCITLGTSCGFGSVSQAEFNSRVSLAADFVPVVGDAKGIYEAYQEPTALNIIAAGVGLIPVVGDAAAKVIKGADHIADAVKAGNKLPKVPTGPGTVAKADRDPKRFFTSSEGAAKRSEQGHQCGNGCDTKIDGTNSAGHHIERHADGGKTVPANHAEVCIPCHKDLHSGG